MKTTPDKSALPSDFAVEVYYDGDCPLCLREINMLKRWDRRGRIRFTDIAAPGFSASAVGIPYDDLMAEIHGRLPNGEIIHGVEVFRQLYAAVGFAWPAAVTRLPVISHTLDLGYRLFARNRLRLTGRCDKNGCQIPKSPA